MNESLDVEQLKTWIHYTFQYIYWSMYERNNKKTQPNKKFNHRLELVNTPITDQYLKDIQTEINSVVTEELKTIIHHSKYKSSLLDLTLKTELMRDNFIGSMFRQLPTEWHNVIIQALMEIKNIDPISADTAISSYIEKNVHRTNALWETTVTQYDSIRKSINRSEAFYSKRYNILTNTDLWTYLQNLNFEFKTKETFDNAIQKWLILKSRSMHDKDMLFQHDLDQWFSKVLFNHPIKQILVSIARGTSKQAQSNQLTSVFKSFTHEQQQHMFAKVLHFMMNIDTDMGSTIGSFNQSVYGEEAKKWSDLEHYFNALVFIGYLGEDQREHVQNTWNVISTYETNPRRQYQTWLKTISEIKLHNLEPIDLDMDI